MADEEKGRLGISLSAYLRAERLYPNSLFARKGIDRLSDRILPESDSSKPAENSTPEAAFSPLDSSAPVPASR